MTGKKSFNESENVMYDGICLDKKLYCLDTLLKQVYNEVITTESPVFLTCCVTNIKKN